MSDQVAELKKKIKQAFSVFDHESNKTADIREMGTIIRSLNCFPTEAQLNEILNEIEEEEPTGYINYEKFEPAMLRILLERLYLPASEERLMKAFEILDTDNKGYLTIDEVQQLMTEEGEPFTQEEIEEMFSAAIDPERGSIFYREYLPLMIVEDDH